MDLLGALGRADWGSVPEWFGAFGTTAAVVVALGSSWHSRRQLAEERVTAAQERAAALTERLEAAEDRQRFRDQHDRELAEARRQGASRVTLTLEDYLPDNKLVTRRQRFVVRNAGPEPISQVHVVSERAKEADLFAIESWGVIEGDGSRLVRNHPAESQRPCEVRFVDTNGVPWRRSEDGTLTERAGTEATN